MGFLTGLSLVLAIGLFVYLCWALFRAEKL
jgi:K+-transporting ATPase KdpF subunit